MAVGLCILVLAVQALQMHTFPAMVAGNLPPALCVGCQIVPLLAELVLQLAALPIAGDCSMTHHTPRQDNQFISWQTAQLNTQVATAGSTSQQWGGACMYLAILRALGPLRDLVEAELCCHKVVCGYDIAAAVYVGCMCPGDCFRGCREGQTACQELLVIWKAWYDHTPLFDQVPHTTIKQCDMGARPVSHTDQADLVPRC